MSMTINLKPETEKHLAQEARKKGLKIETFIEVLIEEQVNGKTENQPENSFKMATKEERIAAFHKWLDSHKDKNYPILPDEAFSRENIYEDRF